MVLNDLKNRGLKNVLIFSTDNLLGFSQVITAVYPKAEIQKCIIHQIRSSTRCVNHKDIKELMNDLKTIYKANTEEVALVQLDYFDNKWNKKYPSYVESWKKSLSCHGKCNSQMDIENERVGSNNRSTSNIFWRNFRKLKKCGFMDNCFTITHKPHIITIGIVFLKD